MLLYVYSKFTVVMTLTLIKPNIKAAFPLTCTYSPLLLLAVGSIAWIAIFTQSFCWAVSGSLASGPTFCFSRSAASWSSSRCCWVFKCSTKFPFVRNFLAQFPNGQLNGFSFVYFVPLICVPLSQKFPAQNPHMYPHVNFHVPRFCKTFSAKRAWEWLFIRMGSCMDFMGCAPAKAFSALLAHVRSFSCMQSLMFH